MSKFLHVEECLTLEGLDGLSLYRAHRHRRLEAHRGDGGLPNTWFAPVNASAAAHAAEQAQCDEPTDVYLVGPSAESPFRECSNGVGLGCACCRGSDGTVAANSPGCCRAAADA